jgi:hypothetical protein
MVIESVVLAQTGRLGFVPSSSVLSQRCRAATVGWGWDYVYIFY